MYIHEAIMATNIKYPCITREAWARLSLVPYSDGIKLQPTNSPDGCILISDARGGLIHGWQPTAADLIADDWKIARL